MANPNRAYKIVGRIVVWRNKTFARSNQGTGLDRGRRANANNRIVVFTSKRKARRSIPRGLGG